MKRINFTHVLIGTLLSIFIMGLTQETQAQSRKSFHFLASPSSETNRVYRVNIYNGEMAACWYSKSLKVERGITDCRKPGPGAGPQKRGLYKLVASNVPSEKGVFRVNELTGEMSICWHTVSTDTVVCTEQAR